MHWAKGSPHILSPPTPPLFSLCSHGPVQVGAYFSVPEAKPREGKLPFELDKHPSVVGDDLAKKTLQRATGARRPYARF